MELKNPIALYICAGVAAVFLIVMFITFRLKRKYKGGKKTYLPDYLKNDSMYKTRLVWHVILKYVLIVLIITSILLSGFLMARPYKTESKQLANYNRDIMLCMDISTTCDNLNAELIDKLEDVVRELNGERFGIVIFNSSPVLLCPLTNDYNYIIEVLDKVKEGLKMRLDYMNGKILFSDKLYEMDAYISNGTLVDNEERGSSIIGDGLAAACLDFYDYEEKPDRTRVIILSTDNELLGEEIITLPEAGQMCQDRDIVVFGVGTEKMVDADRKMMKDVVEGTGGTFYYGEDSDIVENIVEDIRAQIATLDDTQYEIVEYETPEKVFRLLLLSLSLMLLVAFILKV
ncbi:MAG: hypothetical protein IIY21_07820 [Clostridiales bacterium]|nr:hypothetical protein [Clostridiales bacterium]MBQ1293933.1 hypothetical protein [Clostridiales bacterium]MBQ1571380.1 hypothetical protein [Clostridiales bacterium]MBQ5768649.1 hypothetical protein [Clostridiales bacterium]